MKDKINNTLILANGTLGLTPGSGLLNFDASQNSQGSAKFYSFARSFSPSVLIGATISTIGFILKDKIASTAARVAIQVVAGLVPVLTVCYCLYQLNSTYKSGLHFKKNYALQEGSLLKKTREFLGKNWFDLSVSYLLFASAATVVIKGIFGPIANVGVAALEIVAGFVQLGAIYAKHNGSVKRVAEEEIVVPEEELLRRANGGSGDSTGVNPTSEGVSVEGGDARENSNPVIAGIIARGPGGGDVPSSEGVGGGGVNPSL